MADEQELNAILDRLIRGKAPEGILGEAGGFESGTVDRFPSPSVA